MKKFLALALAILMMAAIAVPAMAAEFAGNVAPTINNFNEETLWEETRYGNGNDNSSETNYLTDAADEEVENTRIEYGVAQAYTVKIPADVRLYEEFTDNTNKTIGYVYGIEELSVSDVVVAGDEELNIYLSSANYNDKNTTTNGWTLIDTEVNNQANVAQGPSANVNYKIVAADVAYDEDGAAIAAPGNYLTSAEYAGTTGVVSSDNRTEADGKATARDGLILTCLRANGNQGTTGSTKTINLYFSSKGTAQEGTYRDVLTFTVRIQKTIADATTGA